MFALELNLFAVIPKHLLAKPDDFSVINFYIKVDLFMCLKLVLVVEVFQELNHVKLDQHLQLLLVHLGFKHLKVFLLLLNGLQLFFELLF